MAQLVKNLLAMRETWVQSLGWKDTLEKGKVTHFSILAYGGHKELNMTELLTLDLIIIIKDCCKKTEKSVAFGTHHADRPARVVRKNEAPI